MRIQRIIIRIFIAVVMIIGIFSYQALAQDLGDFSKFQPPQSTLVDTHTMNLGGRDFFSAVYASGLTMPQIIEYYQNLFVEEEYALILDRKVKKVGKLIRFKRGDHVVSIALLPKKNQTQVAISQYLQRADSPSLSLEGLDLSWQEFMEIFPKKEWPGEDIDIIPRPPESVRVLSMGRAKSKILHYSSPISAQEVKEFYAEVLPSYGWYMVKEVSMKDTLKLYKETTGKEILKGVPFFPGVNLEELIAGGYVLYYNNSEENARAQIQVFNLYPRQERGAEVQIHYEEK